MSQFFLNNAAISVDSYVLFKAGCLRLIAIEKMEGHVFFKHESVYGLAILVDGLYQAGMGYEEQEIYRFLEHLSPCLELIENETAANEFCESETNGFLGIDFENTGIPEVKQIRNNDNYRTWCFKFLEDSNELLLKTDLHPDSKKIHISDHHGKNELKALCKRLKLSPYVVEMQSTDWGGNRFIRKVTPGGVIEIVLHKSERPYALNVLTTGRDLEETTKIADILREKFDD